MNARRVFFAPGLLFGLFSLSAPASAQDDADAGEPAAKSPDTATPAAKPSADDDDEGEPAPARPAKKAPSPPPAVAAETAPAGPRPLESVSLPPGMPDFGGEVSDGTQTGGAMAGDGYHFDFHGYVRAPLRVGDGPRNDGSPGKELHSSPRIADSSYTDWSYTNQLPGPWTELLLSYGNSRASMTASIASYNQTVAGYRDLQAQLGINQAFVTLNFPNAFGRFGGLRGVFGSFTNRYGSAGKYGGGMYDTYLFGRTRTAGETLTANFDLSPDVTLIAEHGIGAKLDVIPFDPAATTHPDFEPYQGPVPQGSTFVHHAHLALDISHALTLGAHYLTVWTPDDHHVAGALSQPGRMTITGGEARIAAGAFGDGYIGYSHISATHILPISDAIEVLHSLGGASFKSNFFGAFDPVTRTKLPDDGGTVDSVLFQYTLGLGALTRYPKKFGGNGPDLTLTPFGMWNKVKSEHVDNSRLKFGADLFYTPLDVLGVGARYDLVQPDLKDSKQSFSLISPRVVLRTAFVTHEAITFQYSHYFLGSKVAPGFPNDNGVLKPDPDVVMISASMWW